MKYEPSFETVTLEALRVGLRRAISMEFVHDAATYAVHADILTHQMIATLETQVLAERLPMAWATASERVEFEVPATWWQHFKQAHPRLTARLRPVRMTTLGETAHMSVNLERYWTYPEAKRLPAARFGRPVRFVIEPDIRTWLGDVA